MDKEIKTKKSNALIARFEDYTQIPENINKIGGNISHGLCKM